MSIHEDLLTTTGFDGITVSFGDGCDHDSLSTALDRMTGWVVDVRTADDQEYCGAFHITLMPGGQSAIKLSSLDYVEDSTDITIPFDTVVGIHIY